MHAAAETPTACENCGTMLQGAFCHACGQNSHNPLRNVAHAVEEVFESFWHLDGRVFRTLRDLLVPGRVACNYLAGQRVRYIAPLRLFIVLTLLTFFVGRLLFSAPQDAAVKLETGDDGNVGVHIDDKPGTTFAKAATEAEVIRQRDEALQGIAEGRKAVGLLPIASQGLERAEAKVRADAELRIVQLRREGGTRAAAAVPAPSTAAGAPSTPAPASARAAAKPAAGKSDRLPDFEGGIDKVLRRMDSARLRDAKARWHPLTNPVDMSWLPGWGDRWLNHKLETVVANMRRFSRGDGFIKAYVAALPTALFLMMPVFALLLRLFYMRRPHGVLEHLVVALYSHAFLLMAMIAIFVLSAVGGALVPAVAWLFYVAMTGVIVYIPVYLLLMQKRVYGQSWPKTLLKYLLIGGSYQVLLGFAATFAALLPFLGGE